MDSKIAVMFALVVLAVIIGTSSAGKHKKVIIHVPYKVKNIKHTHTVYKTIHHHHGHGGHGHGHKSHGGHSHGHGHDEVEDHEHFHHHGGDHHGFHSMPVAQYVLPDINQIPMPVPLPVHYFNQRR